MQTSTAKKLPYLVAILFFGVSGTVSMLKGGGAIYAAERGAVAAVVAWVLSSLLTYVIFSENLPEAKAPAGMEDVEKEFRTKSGGK